MIDFASPVKVPPYSTSNVNCSSVCMPVFILFSYLVTEKESSTPILGHETPTIV